jgi:hypothetical protein
MKKILIGILILTGCGFAHAGDIYEKLSDSQFRVTSTKETVHIGDLDSLIIRRDQLNGKISDLRNVVAELDKQIDDVKALGIKTADELQKDKGLI